MARADAGNFLQGLLKDAPPALQRIVRQGESWCAVVGSPISCNPTQSVDDLLNEALQRGHADGATLLTTLDGAFVAFLYDAESRQLCVVTDPLGLQPVYYTRQRGHVALGLTIHSVAAHTDDRSEDLAWCGALLVLGHGLGDRTMLRAIRRVPPASIVCIDVQSGNVNWERQYWRLPVDDTATASHDEHTGNVRGELERWLQASLREYRAGALLLSGGYDSRLALALAMSANVKPALLTVNHRDENANADARFAQSLARHIGWPIQVLDPPHEYFDGETYERYCALTEHVTASRFLFISTIASALPHLKDAAWDGLLPGFLNVTPYEMAGFTPYLQHVAFRHVRSIQENPFLVRDWLEAALDAFTALLQEEQRSWPDTAQGVLGFGLRNRARLRFAPNPVSVVGSHVPLHLPGATRNFWEAVVRVPVEHRAGGSMHRSLLQQLAPALLRIPAASGQKLEAPTPASRRQLALQQLRAWPQRELSNRPRVVSLLQRMGVPVPFKWQPSSRAYRALEQAGDFPELADMEQVEKRLAQQNPVAPDEAALPLIALVRALSAARQPPSARPVAQVSL